MCNDVIIVYYYFAKIVRALEGDASLDDLNEGMKHSSSTDAVNSSGSSEFDGTYNSDMKRFRKHPNNLTSGEFTSSEHGNTTEFTKPSPARSVGDSQEFIRRLNL